jgi:hypothetical protein
MSAPRQMLRAAWCRNERSRNIEQFGYLAGTPGAGEFVGSLVAERVAQLGGRMRCFLRYNAQGSLGWLQCSPLLSELDLLAIFAIELR